MTQYEPTLVVQRLVVKRDLYSAYDERFHLGVNIIRGENSSGKSTILNFIFYGLGGDLKDWSDAARLCTRVYVEVSLNGKIATLSREVSTQPAQPMDIFGGDYDASRNAGPELWNRYPYKRSPSKESFSQALFRLLNLPEVANEVSGNITMHQYMRLLYADQLSSIEHLFRDDDFDTGTLRDTVGRLICGIYDGQYYENSLKIRALEKQFDDLTGSLRSLYQILGSEDITLNMSWVNVRREALAKEHVELQEGVEISERNLFVAERKDKLTLAAQTAAFERVQELQKELGAVSEQREALALDTADSAAFIVSLEKKLQALKDSDLTSTEVGDVEFQVCPACFAAVKPPQPGTLSCHLCHAPFDLEKVKGRIVGMMNDIAIQLRQSRQLQEQRRVDQGNLDKKFEELKANWHTAASTLSETQRMPSSKARDELRGFHRRLGYLEREREDLEQKAKLIGQVEELQKRKASAAAEVILLRDANEALRRANTSNLSIAYATIESGVRSLLIHDLRRQDSFEDPKHIDFSFEKNRITVDGVGYFSASSRAILKSSFMVALLAAATKHSFFRHPRFCMLDTIEDKGMEILRSHNFQLRIAAVSAESKAEHQIIFATAMIEPSLDEVELTIGRFSTRDEPTLAILSQV